MSSEIASGIVSNFWVSAYPYFESTLFVSAPPERSGAAQAIIYDPDGMLVNEVTISARPGQLGILEMGPLLGSCKIESGIKHAHLEVRSPPGFGHIVRLHTSSLATLLGEPVEISQRQTNFFPLTFAENKSLFVCLVNYAEREAKVRCRLYFGRRMPEVECIVPPLGCRLLDMNSEFSEYSVVAGGKERPGYIRLSSSIEQGCGAQLLEVSQAGKEGYIFSAVS